jgi:hypothetical protein
VSVATAGTDYANFAYPFPAGATTTLVAFNGGLTTTGATSTGTFAVTGSTTLASILNVGGALNANGAVNANSALTVLGTASLQGLTTTGATSTGTFAVTGSTTLAGLLNVNGTLNANGAVNTRGIITSTASAANVFPFASSTALTVSGTGYFGTASTTNLTISSIASGNILKTTTGGSVVAAVAGTDYVTGAGLASAYPFGLTGNATSTLTQFNGGLTAYASTTIGNGTATGGLTISGGATTTGTLTLGNVINFIGGQSTTSLLNITGQTYFAASTTNHSIFLSLGAGVTTLRSGSAAFDNFGVGLQALAANVSGDDNNALGNGALAANTSGSENNAFGFGALNLNTTGSYNNAFGFGALGSNLSGTGNNALGNNALGANTSGIHNNAIGFDTLAFNQDGNYNNAIGYRALRSNTSGSGNSAYGYAALFTNTTGSNNSALGYQAGSSITTGYSNILIGDDTTFVAGVTSGSGNIGIGSNTFFPSQTANRQLNIGNLIFGTNLPATSTAFQLPTSGSFGVGTSSPFAKFAIQTNNGDTATTLFAIGSSTQSATSTLFSVSNTGSTTIANGINLTAGCYAVNGTCLSTSGGSSASSTLLADVNTWSGLNKFTAGFLSLASTTIGNGTAAGGLTVSGGATTTGNAYFAGFVGIGTNTPTNTLEVNGTGYFASGVTISGEVATGGHFTSSNSGTAASPTFGFVFDGGTGIFDPGGGGSHTLGFSTNSVERLRIDAAGNVGVGTTSPFAKFSIQSNNGDTNTTLFAIGSSTASATTTLFSVANTGDVTINGSSGTTCTIGNGVGGTSCTSDARLKTNIVSITGVDALAKLSAINGVTFNWLDQAKNRQQFVGVIAQDVQKQFPQTVSTTTGGYLEVDYSALVAPLISGVNELNARTQGLGNSTSTVSIGAGVIAFSRPATTTIAIGINTWTIATSTAAGTLPIISVSAPASSTPSVSINGTLYLNGSDVGVAIASSSATTTQEVVTASFFASATDGLKSAINSALATIQNITQIGVRNLGAAVYATVGTFNNLFAQTITADSVKTKELCIDDVCVNKTQLQNLLNGQNTAQASSGSTPEVTDPVPSDEMVTSPATDPAPTTVEGTGEPAAE